MCGIEVSINMFLLIKIIDVLVKCLFFLIVGTERTCPLTNPCTLVKCPENRLPACPYEICL